MTTGGMGPPTPPGSFARGWMLVFGGAAILAAIAAWLLGASYALAGVLAGIAIGGYLWLG